MKKRILMCGESSHVPSGFGNYTKHILNQLHNSNKYEIAELSCYRDTSIPKTEPWKIYPAAVNSSHPLYQEYVSNDANQFGQWLFELVLLDFKPHIVFDVRDFWNFTYQETSCLRHFYHWVLAPTYDSAPPKIDTINTFSNADTLCFHTEWAKNNLINEFNYNNSNISHVVSDAIDHNIFKPIGYSKKFHKIKYDIPSDAYVIGSVMRNQKRKLIPDILKVFAELVKNHTDKNILLYLHTSYPDGMAWDLPALLLEYGVADKVLLTYTCTSCNKIFPSVFKSHQQTCKHCNNNSAFIAGVRYNMPDYELNNIYNLFDMYIQYAICEGFGIPPIEAAACGIPVITIDHEAMGEVGRNIGAELVPVQRIFREQETNAERCYPDNTALYDILTKYISMSFTELNSIGVNCRKLCKKKYSWEYTAKVFEEIFDNVDISNKLPWDSPIRSIDTSYHVHEISSHRQCIYNIVDGFIKEPFLKNTNFIEELIKNANEGLVYNGLKQFVFKIDNYIKILEMYAKNKTSLESMRVNPNIKLDKFKDIMEYSDKNK